MITRHGRERRKAFTHFDKLNTPTKARVSTLQQQGAAVRSTAGAASAAMFLLGTSTTKASRLKALLPVKWMALTPLRAIASIQCGALDYDFDGKASISGLIKSSGSGNTMVEDLPLLDMSAMVCR